MIFSLDSYKEYNKEGSTIQYKDEVNTFFEMYEKGEISRDELFTEVYRRNGNIIEYVLVNSFQKFLGSEIGNDLRSEALFGFLTALDKFDYKNERGASFFTYAKFWVFKYVYNCANEYTDHNFDDEFYEEKFGGVELNDEASAELYTLLASKEVENLDENFFKVCMCADIFDECNRSSYFIIAKKYDITVGSVKRVREGRGKIKGFYDEFIKFINSDGSKDLREFFDRCKYLK